MIWKDEQLKNKIVASCIIIAIILVKSQIFDEEEGDTLKQFYHVKGGVWVLALQYSVQM